MGISDKDIPQRQTKSWWRPLNLRSDDLNLANWIP